MPTEIERKYLVTGTAWRTAEPLRICQGYLNRDKHRTVRVRIAGAQGCLTVKGLTTGASRAEFEYPIPLADAEALLALCDGPCVDKLRHRVEHAGRLWEVDEFLGRNAGLVVAEVELADEHETVVLPPWAGREVTEDRRYFNSSLAARPYDGWDSAGED